MSRTSINANDPKNWKTFDEVHAAYGGGQCDGIGIVLSEEPLHTDTQGPLYLAAVDMDDCKGRSEEVRAVRARLGHPYGEISPSNKGVHFFVLTRKPIKGGNAGNGNEIYCQGRFMTVTGVSGEGDAIEATDALSQLEKDWFPRRESCELRQAAPSANSEFQVNSPLPETPEHIARAKEQLSYVDADCSYEIWRNIIWAIRSTGWECAEALAREWSQNAPHRFGEMEFLNVVNSFDPNGGITLGTLVHHAKAGGWMPVVSVSHSPEARRRLLTADELRCLSPIRWLVRGLMPSRGVGTIYGAAGSGKTFLALDLACSLATERREWFSLKSKPISVVYIALEGQAGIRQRVMAWEKLNYPINEGRIRFLQGDFRVLDSKEVNNLAVDILEELGKPCLVFIDTLNQAAPGADENGSADMGRVIANAKHLADTLDGLVVLVHHAGKDASRGMRGHSSLFAAMDTVIEVTQSGARRSWRVTKSKDGETGAEHGFELVPQQFGFDEDGLPVISCAVRASEGLPEAIRPAPRGKQQQSAMNALKGLLATHPKGIPLDQAIDGVAGVLGCEARRKASRAREIIEGLNRTGHLLTLDERVRIV